MLSLSPAKLLVVLVVALIVLGPEKLPQVARQVGSLWGDLRKWRARIETEVRSTFPDLPPAHEVVQAVRSPLSFLDRLADAHESTASNGDGPALAAGEPAAGGDAVGTDGVRASPTGDTTRGADVSATNGSSTDPGPKHDQHPSGPVPPAGWGRPVSLPSAADVEKSEWDFDDPSMN